MQCSFGQSILNNLAGYSAGDRRRGEGPRPNNMHLNGPKTMSTMRLWRPGTAHVQAGTARGGCHLRKEEWRAHRTRDDDAVMHHRRRGGRRFCFCNDDEGASQPCWELGRREERGKKGGAAWRESRGSRERDRKRENRGRERRETRGGVEGDWSATTRKTMIPLDEQREVQTVRRAEVGGRRVKNN